MLSYQMIGRDSHWALIGFQRLIMIIKAAVVVRGTAVIVANTVDVRAA